MTSLNSIFHTFSGDPERHQTNNFNCDKSKTNNFDKPLELVFEKSNFLEMITIIFKQTIQENRLPQDLIQIIHNAEEITPELYIESQDIIRKYQFKKDANSELVLKLNPRTEQKEVFAQDSKIIAEFKKTRFFSIPDSESFYQSFSCLIDCFANNVKNHDPYHPFMERATPLQTTPSTLPLNPLFNVTNITNNLTINFGAPQQHVSQKDAALFRRFHELYSSLPQESKKPTDQSEQETVNTLFSPFYITPSQPHEQYTGRFPQNPKKDSSSRAAEKSVQADHPKQTRSSETPNNQRPVNIPFTSYQVNPSHPYEQFAGRFAQDPEKDYGFDLRPNTPLHLSEGSNSQFTWNWVDCNSKQSVSNKRPLPNADSSAPPKKRIRPSRKRKSIASPKPTQAPSNVLRTEMNSPQKHTQAPVTDIWLTKILSDDSRTDESKREPMNSPQKPTQAPVNTWLNKILN